MDLLACQSPSVLSALQEIVSHSDWRDDENLSAIWLLAYAWLAVATLARAETNEQTQAAAQPFVLVYQYILRIVRESSGGARTIGPVINLLAAKLRQPQDLVDFMQNIASQRLEVVPGRQIRNVEDAFHDFLASGRVSTPKEEAERLLPYAQIVSAASGDSRLSGQQLKTCRVYLLEHLKRTDSTTVRELNRLVERLAQERSRAYLKDEWHSFMGDLPPELRAIAGVRDKAAEFVRRLTGSGTRSTSPR
jgi:hypothetical protein